MAVKAVPALHGKLCRAHVCLLYVRKKYLAKALVFFVLTPLDYFNVGVIAVH